MALGDAVSLPGIADEADRHAKDLEGAMVLDLNLVEIQSWVDDQPR